MREIRTEALYRKTWNSMDRELSRLSSTKSQQMKLSRCYWELSTARRPRWIELLLSIYRANRMLLNGSRICREAIETNSQKLWWIKIALTWERRSRGLIDSLAVERYWEDVEKCKNSFSKKRKRQKWMQSSMLLNQRSNQHFKL